ncbi:hypothetical protein [Arthrobacter cryoconiti]|uniref:Uncharacterized protein n=1 Tax=Arthrobacter cryoconiti TaxID=748907 RepID=A0ABV8R472_9MICC|nr:hypothetical protein [Arthrobacter cryoconiti]MCC9069325.1 hypothetical protein [Arthrobacter cryoconiti]
MSEQFTFEKVQDENGNLLWLGARALKSPRNFFVWVPNTSSWHRYPELEPGAGYVDGVVFEPSTPEEIQELIPGNRRIDERALGWVVDEFRAQPAAEIRSSVDLGLPASAGPQPTRGLDLPALPEGEWITLKAYPEDGYRRAISLASDIRQGKRKKLLMEGFHLDARVEAVPAGFELQIRKVKG